MDTYITDKYQPVQIRMANIKKLNSSYPKVCRLLHLDLKVKNKENVRVQVVYGHHPDMTMKQIRAFNELCKTT